MKLIYHTEMEKNNMSLLEEIKAEIEALKSKLGELESKVAELETVALPEEEDLPEAEEQEVPAVEIEQKPAEIAEDLPEEPAFAEPIDIAVDIEDFSDIAIETPAIEVAPVAEPVEAPVAEPVAEPVEVQVAEPVAEPVEAPVAEPAAEPVEAPVEVQVAAPVAEPVEAPVEAPKPEEAPLSMFGDEEVVVVKKSINDAEKSRAKKAVLDVANEKLAWKTDRPGTPVKNIISGISLADRALLINTLFKGEPIAFNDTITALNGLSSFAEAEEYIQTNFPEWNMASNVVYRLMMAIRRKLS